MLDRKTLIRTTLLTALTLFGLTALPVPPTALAQSACQDSQFCIFIPNVVQRPDTPQLLSPAPDEALTILAPIFKWSTPLPGRYLIQVAETADFSGVLDLNTTVRIRDTTQQVERVANSNLDARKTYYWRVGIEEPLDSGNYKFSATRSFTSPQRKEAAQQPPIPTLRSPGNGASLRANVTSVTVVWDAVPGALYYRVNLDRADGVRVGSALVPGTQNSAVFTGADVITRGANYTWEVKAVNSYGWSDFSEPFRFRIQSN